MKQVLTYEDPEGNTTISRLGSFLAWRDQNKVTVAPRDEAGTCKICGGFGVVRTRQWGAIRCLCEIETETARLALQLREYRSIYVPKDFDDIVLWGTPESRKALSGARDKILKWLDWPDYWITMIGMTGTGKTMAMEAIASHFKTWCLYITATDFEAHLGRLMDNQDGEETLTEFLDALRYAPFLIFDDLGSEYQKAGRDWVKANLRKIIDFRYLRPNEYPTIITTNLNEDRLREYDMRIGSRILDTQLVEIISLSNVGDYRRLR
jgi:DNA replication protein DnaC